MKAKLNGYWTKKDNPALRVYVEKVYKAGHVVGFSYTKTDTHGEVIGEFKASHEELTAEYTKC
jgi:hypothetical protein